MHFRSEQELNFDVASLCIFVNHGFLQTESDKSMRRAESNKLGCRVNEFKGWPIHEHGICFSKAEYWSDPIQFL